MSDNEKREVNTTPIAEAGYRLEQMQALYRLTFDAVKPEGKGYDYRIANLARLILDTVQKWDSGDLDDPIAAFNAALVEIATEREKAHEGDSE